MLTAGLGVHQAVRLACVLDDGGRSLEEGTIRGGRERVVERVGSLVDRVQVCFEASVDYGPPRHCYFGSADMRTEGDPPATGKRPPLEHLAQFFSTWDDVGFLAWRPRDEAVFDGSA